MSDLLAGLPEDTLREESPQLVLALIEARFPQGTHEVYQVPIGIRPASEGWSDRVIAEVGDRTYYDALADPAHARELLHLMRAGADVQAGEGMLAFRWAGGAGEGGTVEVFGRSRFPAIGEWPYLLTLAPRGFYWFQLVVTG